jgi:hypothetical protein
LKRLITSARSVSVELAMRAVFDGDCAIEPGIAGAIHLAHAAAAEAFVDFVRTEARPGGHRHRRSYYPNSVCRDSPERHDRLRRLRDREAVPDEAGRPAMGTSTTVSPSMPAKSDGLQV